MPRYLLREVRLVTEQQTLRLDEEIPQAAEGLDLMGLFEGSGFRERPYLARRADGQVVQLSWLLYLVTEAVDGRRSYEEIAEIVTEEFGRDVSADNVRYLVENKLRLLGVVAEADGYSVRAERATPLFMLRFKVGLVPARAVRAITTVLWPLFLAPVMIAVVGGLIAFDLWLALFHGGIGSGIQDAIYDPGAFVVLAFIVSGVAVSLHECGHATACRYGGARPGKLGVGIYIVWLIFYSDVTDSYRLNKLGRVRTDLGGLYMESVLIMGVVGAYFYTGHEFLLPLIVLMQVSFIDDLLPILRFDGYYIVSDITGVPDLFGRIKPILKSMIPGQPQDPQVAELRPWVRVVVTAWVLLVVPLLITVVSVLAFYLPLMISTAWDSFQRHSGELSSAYAQGDILETLKSLFQVGALFIPVLGVILILWIWGRRIGRAAWRASAGSPLFRAGVLALPFVIGAIIALFWLTGNTNEERSQRVETPNARSLSASEVPSGGSSPEAGQSPGVLTAAEQGSLPGASQAQGSGSPAPGEPAGQSAQSAGMTQGSGSSSSGGQGGTPGPFESIGPASGSDQYQYAGDQGQDAEDLVAQFWPQAEYVGGRMDTQADGSGRNRNVLYYVDPNLPPCRYERLEYTTNDGAIQTAIVAGEGSFETGNGAGCIPGY